MRAGDPHQRPPQGALAGALIAPEGDGGLGRLPRPLEHVGDPAADVGLRVAVAVAEDLADELLHHGPVAGPRLDGPALPQVELALVLRQALGIHHDAPVLAAARAGEPQVRLADWFLRSERRDRLVLEVVAERLAAYPNPHVSPEGGVVVLHEDVEGAPVQDGA